MTERTEAVAAAAAKPTRPKAILTDDMTVTDVTAALETLSFGRGPMHCLVSLDRGVRDYILRALRRRFSGLRA